MPRGKPLDGSKNPGGRPRGQWFDAPDEVIAEKIFALASEGNTGEYISSFLGISRQTLYRNEKFVTSFKNGSLECKATLRQTQVRLARKGNPTMLIWLGKNMLGQKDRHEFDTRQKDRLQELQNAKMRGLKSNEDDSSGNG